MASCPRRLPNLPLRPCGGLITPRFHRASEKDTLSPKCSRPVIPLGRAVLRLLLPATPVIAGFPSVKTDSAFGVPCLLPRGATRLVPRFFPTGASIARCQEFRTIEAPMPAPRLGLGSFPLVGHPRGCASRLGRAGIPTRRPSRSPRLGRVQAPYAPRSDGLDSALKVPAGPRQPRPRPTMVNIPAHTSDYWRLAA